MAAMLSACALELARWQLDMLATSQDGRQEVDPHMKDHQGQALPFERMGRIWMPRSWPLGISLQNSVMSLNITKCQPLLSNCADSSRLGRFNEELGDASKHLQFVGFWSAIFGLESVF